MAFLIPDNLKSRTDVPPEVRNVARALELGLDDDAVVWFEPACSPDAAQPDLIVLLPDLGITVLQVFGGDEWKLLQPPAGSAPTRGGQRGSMEERLRLADQVAEVLRSRIANEPRLHGGPVPVAVGTVFPSVHDSDFLATSAGLPLPLRHCLLLKTQLDAAMSGSGEAALLRAFRRILGESTPPLSDQTTAALRELAHSDDQREKLLRGLVHPAIVIDRLCDEEESGQLSIFRPPPKGESEDILRVMDRKQEALATSLGTGHRVIRGVAGSGKTLILVFRIRLLARLFPQQKFLLTCYTRSLAAQLRGLLKGYRNIDVKNLHKIMVGVIRLTGEEPPDVKDESALSEAAIAALHKVPQKKYRAVFVDEAQDLGTDALRFAIALLDSPTGDFVVVADAAQNIFRRKFSWKKAGIQAAGRTQILRQNYRNTREILDFAFRFLLTDSSLKTEPGLEIDDEQTLIPPESAARAGPPPEVRIEHTVDGEIESVVKQVQSWVSPLAGPRQIAVLYANGNEQNRALRIYRALSSTGLPVFWAHQKSFDAIGDATEAVVLASVHAAKGLEFPQVVLCGLWRPEEDPVSNRRLAYVGMTRAMDRLAVVALADTTLAADLRTALDSDRLPQPSRVAALDSSSRSSSSAPPAQHDITMPMSRLKKQEAKTTEAVVDSIGQLFGPSEHPDISAANQDSLGIAVNWAPLTPPLDLRQTAEIQPPSAAEDSPLSLKAIQATVLGLPLDAEKGKNPHIAEHRTIHPRAYENWSETEDDLLMKAFALTQKTKDLTQVFMRQSGAINSRLRKLGLKS